MNPRTGVGVLSVKEVYRTVIGSAVLDRAVRARSWAGVGSTEWQKAEYRGNEVKLASVQVLRRWEKGRAFYLPPSGGGGRYGVEVHIMASRNFLWAK